MGDDLRREPDELDQLLQRTNDAVTTTAASSSKSTAGLPSALAGGAVACTKIGSTTTKTTTGQHRKSLTIATTTFPTAGGGGLWMFTSSLPTTVHTDPKQPRRTHRRNMSSISELIGNVTNPVDFRPIGDDFRRTVSSVRTAFVEELDEFKKGTKSGFFDMTATRSLAVTPDDLFGLGKETGVVRRSSTLHKYRRPALEESDVVVVQEEEEGDEGEDTQEGATGDTGLATLQTTGGKEIVFNFLMLMAAVAAHSSNSTALHMLVGVSPPIKLFWRMSASYLLLLPLAIRFLYQEGFPKLSLAGCLTFASAAFFYSAQNLLFYTALEYTTIGNAVIYANSQALLLIVGKAFVGERIHILEGIGVVVAFGGAVVCSQDSERESEASPETDDNALFGDFLALCSSALGVAYLTVAKAVRSEMSVSFFITFVMFVGSIMILTYLSINPHEELSFDMDPYHGVFGGFSTTHHRFAVMAYLAIVVNMVGSMGFIRAMEFFDTVVIAVATLIEPLTASFIAYAFNAGLLPGPLGWVGNCLVFVGTLMVVYPSMGRAEKGMH